MEESFDVSKCATNADNLPSYEGICVLGAPRISCVVTQTLIREKAGSCLIMKHVHPIHVDNLWPPSPRSSLGAAGLSIRAHL